MASLDTRVRYRVVAFAVALAAVTYLDRVCISTLAPTMMRELGLDRLQMSFVFSSFALAYAAFEIPTAWWGERIGTRRVLTRIVAWWSTFTIATAASFHYSYLLAVRFLFGAGEAGAWPNAARTFSRWIPAIERGRVQGIFFMGAHFAGGITPPLVAFLEPRLGWRGVFIGFGLIGYIWAFSWYRWFRDEPSEHPAVSAGELRLITEGRLDAAHPHGAHRLWRRLLTSRNLWALCGAYFANSYGFYFLITWLPTYLEQARGMSKGALSLFAGLPLLLSVLGDFFGGVVTDKLTRAFGLRIGRAAVGVSAYLVSAAAMFASTAVVEPRAAAALIAVAAAASMFTLGASWAACIDIGGPNSGVLSAAMNTSGQVGAILSPIVLALILDRFADWAAPLHVMGVLYLIASVSWLFVDPRRRLGDS